MRRRVHLVSADSLLGAPLDYGRSKQPACHLHSAQFDPVIGTTKRSVVTCRRCQRLRPKGAPMENPTNRPVQSPPLTERLTLENVEEAFQYQPWDEGQLAAGKAVRNALV